MSGLGIVWQWTQPEKIGFNETFRCFISLRASSANLPNAIKLLGPIHRWNQIYFGKIKTDGVVHEILRHA